MADVNVDCQDCEGNVVENTQPSENVKVESEPTKRRVRVTPPKSESTPTTVVEKPSKPKRERSEKQREAFLRCQEARKNALQRVKDGLETPPERKSKKTKVDTNSTSVTPPPPPTPMVVEKVIERFHENPAVIENIVRSEMEKVKESLTKPVNELIETVKRTHSVAPSAASSNDEVETKTPVNAASILPNTKANTRRQVYYDMLKAEIMR